MTHPAPAPRLPAVESPPAAPDPSPLADLILARLVTAKREVKLSIIAADLAPLFHRPPSTAAVTAVFDGLRDGGLVSREKGPPLTAAGRARALAYLGAADLPPRANWGTVKANYLTPRALGLPPKSTAVATVNKLAAVLLKRKLGLPVGTGATLNAVFEAVACRELGFRDHATLKPLIPTLLGRAIGGTDAIAGKDAEAVVPRVLLNAPRGGVAGLRAVALAGFGDGGPSTPQVPPEAHAEAFDLEAFALTVRSAARTCPTGRFGDNKVFISHVWRELEDEPRFAPLGLPGFKAHLVAANRERLLNLLPADLNQAFDPADLRESAATQFHSTYHFIVVGDCP